MSSQINDGIRTEGTARRGDDGSVADDPRLIASGKRSVDPHTMEHFKRLLDSSQVTVRPKLATPAKNGGADEASQQVASNGSAGESKTHKASEPTVSNHGLRTSKLTEQVASGREAQIGQTGTLAPTGEHTTDTSVATRPADEGSAADDRNKRVMAGYLHGPGFQSDTGINEHFAKRVHIEPADAATLASADSFAMSVEPAMVTSDAAPLVARTEIVELLEQMCSNLYVSGTAESRESRILLLMDAALSGAAVELIRDGAFLKARLHARNETALQLMSAQRAQLHAVLEQASQLYVSVDVVEDESSGHGRAY